MKKIGLSILCAASIMYAQSDISISAGKKDYENSKTKIDGKNLNLKVSHNFKAGKLSLGYTKDDVDRKHPVTKVDLESLHVKKYNALYKHNINKKLNLKASYIKITDNLAPTDQGKIYGLGAAYKLPKGFGAKLDLYKSDYKKFDVNQYDLSFYKGFKFGETKGKFTIIGKTIKIDGDKYGNYTFKDKNYFTTGVKLGINHKGFMAGVGAFFGERVFTVLDDGQKVQHHAMEQDRTYMLSLGKKFKDFDLVAKYSFQNGKELPENQDDVDTKVISLGLTYRF